MSSSLINKIHVGDCLTTMKRWPDKFVNTVITSPPYYGLRDYGVEGQIGLEETPDEFIARLVEVFREVRRVLRDDGTLWVNMGDSYCGYKGENYLTNPKHSNLQSGSKVPAAHVLGTPQTSGVKSKDLMGQPWMLAFALRADGWYLRSDIIWAKKNCMPESVTDRPTKSHEYLFLFAKSESYFYDQEAIREPHTEVSLNRIKRPLHLKEVEGRKVNSREDGDMSQFCHPGGRNKRTVWNVATSPFKEAHFATFPEELIKPCILAGTSAEGYCDCGAPWERLVEVSGGDIGKSWHDHKDDLKNGQRAGNKAKGGNGYSRSTKGWKPTCKCAGRGRRGLVLDPFMGAGTTALVASRLNRDFIGCELNPEYVKMAEKRIAPEIAQGKFL